MARYLITGSSGFIGKALTKALLKRGNEIKTLSHDNIPDGAKPLHPEYIIHLSAYGNKYDQQDPAETFHANLAQLFQLLEMTRHVTHHPYKAFINISTSGHILECDSFYGATKMAGEYLARAFVKKYDLPIVNVRPYSVYGPGDDPAHFIPTALTAFKTNAPLQLSPGVHDWIYVDDVVRALLLIADNAQELKGKSVDVGTGIETTNHAVIGILRDMLAKPGKVEDVEKLRDYDTSSWHANTAVLNSLGWEPAYDIEDGLYNLIHGDNQ